jgi:hypothetical protein
MVEEGAEEGEKPGEEFPHPPPLLGHHALSGG